MQVYFENNNIKINHHFKKKRLFFQNYFLTLV